MSAREPEKHIDFGPQQRAIDAVMTYWLNGTYDEGLLDWWTSPEAAASAREIVEAVMSALEDPDDIVACPCGTYLRRHEAFTSDVEEPFLCRSCHEELLEEGTDDAAAPLEPGGES